MKPDKGGKMADNVWLTQKVRILKKARENLLEPSNVDWLRDMSVGPEASMLNHLLKKRYDANAEETLEFIDAAINELNAIKISQLPSGAAAEVTRKSPQPPTLG